MITQNFKITGLSCNACEAITKNTFEEFGWVKIWDIGVNASEQRVTLTYEGELNIKAIQRELADMDYILDPTPMV